MRGRRNKLAVSTFPFLAVLLCAMGSLILILLVMDRKAHKAVQARARREAALLAEQSAQSEAAQRAELEKKKQQARLAWEQKRDTLHTNLTAEQMELQMQMRKVRDQFSQIAARLRYEQDTSTKLRHKVQDEQSRIQAEERLLATLRSKAGQSDAQSKETNKTVRRMTLDLLQMEQALKDLRAARKREQHTFSVIPYHGRRGENHRPIYVECTAEGVIFHPDRRAMPVTSREILLGRNQPGTVPDDVRSEVKRRIAQQQAKTAKGPGAGNSTPYLLLLVRPDGINTNIALQAVLRDLTEDSKHPLQFGYEFIDADWVLDFPTDDDQPNAQPWMAVAKTPSAPRPAPPPRTGRTPQPVAIPMQGVPGVMANSVAGGFRPGTGTFSRNPGSGPGTGASGTGPRSGGSGSSVPGNVPGGSASAAAGNSSNNRGGLGGSSGSRLAYSGVGVGQPGAGGIGFGTGGSGGALGTNGGAGGGYGLGGSGRSTGSGSPTAGLPGEFGSEVAGLGPPRAIGSGSSGAGGGGTAGSAGAGSNVPGSSAGNNRGMVGNSVAGTGFGTGGNGGPGNGMAGNGGPGNGAPGNGAPGNGAPGNGAPGNGAPGNGAPGNGAPGNGAPGNGAPGNGAPGNGAPGNGAPGNGAPGNGAPGNGAPGNGAPGNSAPGNGAPGNGAPGNGAPGNGAPGNGAPGNGAPGNGAPGNGAPGNGAPGNGGSGYGIAGNGPPGANPSGSSVATGTSAGGGYSGAGGNGGTGYGSPGGSGGSSTGMPGGTSSGPPGSPGATGSGGGSPGVPGQASSGTPGAAGPGSAGGPAGTPGAPGSGQSGTPGGGSGNASGPSPHDDGSAFPAVDPLQPRSQPGTNPGEGQRQGTPPQRPPEDAEYQNIPRKRRFVNHGSGGDGEDSGGSENRFAPPTISASRPRKPAALSPAWVHGGRDWTIYIECRADAVVLYPSEKSFTLAQAASGASVNPLVAEIQKMIARRQSGLRPGDPPFYPQLRLLVRSENIRAFLAVYPALDVLSVPKSRQNLDIDDDVLDIVRGVNP